MTQYVGTSYYIAPEVVMNKFYDEKCDVFSFAFVMFELLTNKLRPFESTMYIEVQIAQNENLRPNFPSDLETDESMDWIVKLVKTCWKHDPKQRPSFANIVEELQKH